MAKGMYVGIDNKARKAKKIYVGIDGVARKVKKVYIGDSSGKARLAWSGHDKKYLLSYSRTDRMSASQGTVIYTSNDCATWNTNTYYNESSYSFLSEICYGNDIFVGLLYVCSSSSSSSSPSNCKVMYSEDGVTWTVSTTFGIGDYYTYIEPHVIYSNASKSFHILYRAYGSSQSNITVFNSTDGKNWGSISWCDITSGTAIYKSQSMVGKNTFGYAKMGSVYRYIIAGEDGNYHSSSPWLYKGLFYSNENGTSWTRFTPFKTGYNVPIFHITDDGSLYAYGRKYDDDSSAYLYKIEANGTSAPSLSKTSTADICPIAYNYNTKEIIGVPTGGGTSLYKLPEGTTTWSSAGSANISMNYNMSIGGYGDGTYLIPAVSSSSIDGIYYSNGAYPNSLTKVSMMGDTYYLSFVKAIACSRE